MKRTFDAFGHARPHIVRLQPYVPGEQPRGGGWTKLNTNENPYPPSPEVGRRVEAEAANLRLYPDPRARELRKALAARFGLGEENVIIGNGSDNLLDLLTRAFGGRGGVGHTVPSYSLYPVVAALADRRLVEVPFDASMRLDADAVASAQADVFFLTSPNAPTGVPFSLATIEEILQRIHGLLVVDEAYSDFGGESAVSLLHEYENLVVVRTFSKSHGLAGMRVGYAFAAPGVVEILDRVRDAYNIDRLAQTAALAALEDEAYFRERRHRVMTTREETRARFEARGWFTYPSAANFLFTRPVDAAGNSGPETAASCFEFLKGRKVLVRYFPAHPLTCDFLRVTVGTDEEMSVLQTALDAWLTPDKRN